MVGFILLLVANRNSNGYEISAQKYHDQKKFFDFSTRGQPACRSAISQARNKIHWEAFRFLLERLNEQTKDLASECKWKGHHVYAVDGSTINLPHREEFLDLFPSARPSENAGHFPKAKLILASNIFTGIPKTACLGEEIYSERAGLRELFPQFEKGSIALLDRGFEAFSVMEDMLSEKINFIIRQRSMGGGQRGELKSFLLSKKKDAVVTLMKDGREIKVRLIRSGLDRKMRPIVLATSLLDQKKYSRKELIALYLKRWGIETIFYQMKNLLKLENFHSKNFNGVLQELWANFLYMGLVAANLAQTSFNFRKNSLKRLSFKNATEWIKEHLPCFIFEFTCKKLLEKIKEDLSVAFNRSYHIRQPGRKNARICKKTYHRWTGGFKNKAIDRYKSKIRKNNGLKP